jgi:hypothetical protein
VPRRAPPDDPPHAVALKPHQRKMLADGTAVMVSRAAVRNKDPPGAAGVEAASNRDQASHALASTRSATAATALKRGTYTPAVPDVFHPVPDVFHTDLRLKTTCVRQRVDPASRNFGMVDVGDICCLTGIDWFAFIDAPDTKAFCSTLADKGDNRQTLVVSRTSKDPDQGGKTVPKYMWAHPALALFMALQAEDRTVHDALDGPLTAWQVTWWGVIRGSHCISIICGSFVGHLWVICGLFVVEM